MNKFSWQKLCFPLFGAQCAPLGLGKTKITCSFLSLCSAHGWRCILTEKSKARYLEGHWRRLGQMWTHTLCAGPGSRCSGPKGNLEIQAWASGSARLGRKPGTPFSCAGYSAVPLWKAGMDNWHVLPICSLVWPLRIQDEAEKGEKAKGKSSVSLVHT